mmetsp:Transcript_6481/g.19664  ORF Transcript_6481/g.19664 Transcript_6481/m.19664 type:complete len:269 (-) Transcript_6481:1851-2657(-)
MPSSSKLLFSALFYNIGNLRYLLYQFRHDKVSHSKTLPGCDEAGSFCRSPTRVLAASDVAAPPFSSILPLASLSQRPVQKLIQVPPCGLRPLAEGCKLLLASRVRISYCVKRHLLDVAEITQSEHGTKDVLATNALIQDNLALLAMALLSLLLLAANDEVLLFEDLKVPRELIPGVGDVQEPSKGHSICSNEGLSHDPLPLAYLVRARDPTLRRKLVHHEAGALWIQRSKNDHTYLLVDGSNVQQGQQAVCGDDVSFSGSDHLAKKYA